MASIAGMLFGSVADWLTPASTVPSAIQSSQTRNDVVLEEKTALLRRPPGQGPFDGPTRMRVIIVPRGRLAGECWLGVWNAYEEHYPAVELENYMTRVEWRDMIEEFNDHVQGLFPCCFCINCGLCCCLCTAGLSCLGPWMCMRELDVKLQRLISRYNAEYGPRGLVFRFRKSWYIASWIEITVPVRETGMQSLTQALPQYGAIPSSSSSSSSSSVSSISAVAPPSLSMTALPPAASPTSAPVAFPSAYTTAPASSSSSYSPSAPAPLIAPHSYPQSTDVPEPSMRDLMHLDYRVYGNNDSGSAVSGAGDVTADVDTALTKAPPSYQEASGIR